MFASGKTAAVASAANYIEDVFSTYLYTGNTTAQTITNGIDLAGKGGMVWIKSRTSAAGHALWDTARTPYYYLVSNATSAQQSVSSSNALTAYNADGFTVTGGSNAWNGSQNYASWTFRKQPKFFDVVTWTGNGVAGRQISHSLGSVPACIIVKGMETTNNWPVYHQSLGNTKHLNLNTTDSQLTSDTWNNTSPTATEFTIGSLNSVNQNGYQFVAYLFAHDAGGFGLTGTDNVISCGSFTTDGSGNFSVNLGYEPQWVMIKSTNNTGVSSVQQNWIIYDSMRGLVTQPTSGSVRLYPNLSNAEASSNDLGVTSTGFESLGNMSASAPFIYIAIRRGPMKVPTSGTSVFSPVTTTGTGSNNRVISSVGFSPDLIINCTRGSTTLDRYTQDRLRGVTPTIYTNTTSAEQANQGIYAVGTLDMTGFTLGTSSGVGFNSASDTYVFECFRRAPSFFDEVCYTGTGSTLTLNHNLGVVPELMIGKSRSATGTNWAVYTTSQGTNSSYLNRDIAFGNNSDWSTAPTSTQFTVPSGADLNISGQTQVMYLFATCAGVSKVGSYTGTGTTKQVDCGFTGGARFVLIKRTDSTGDWYVWDTARGIVSGNDPYLLLNSTAAETTGTDYIDTYSAGFEISSTAPAAINASGGTFIFLAIA
jgi:hypothetical protein